MSSEANRQKDPDTGNRRTIPAKDARQALLVDVWSKVRRKLNRHLSCLACRVASHRDGVIR
jgi:hypothetical protein